MPISLLLPRNRRPIYFGALILALLAGGIGLREASRGNPAEVPVAHVLVLSDRGLGVAQQLESELRRTSAGRGRPEFDYLDAPGFEDLARALSEIGPGLHQYRLIFSPSVLWARAAQLAAPGVPIVFEGVDDPVARCLVDSLRRPGRKATGYMHYLPSDDFKSVETLLDAFPRLSRVIFLVDAQGTMPLACDGTPAAPPEADGDCRAGLREPDAYLDRRIRATELRAFGRARGVAVDFAILCGARDIAGLEGRLGARGAAGLVVPTQDLFEAERARVVEAVNRARLPAIYQTHAATSAGGLMSLAPILDVNADRVSVRTAVEVWRGRDPRTLPVQSPRGFSLVVNVTTARQTGLVPSAFALKRADRVLRPPER